MQLSVVIPCFNAAETLGEQLYALSKQQWHEPWEVIIVNNGCTDKSMYIARQYKNGISNLRIVNAHEKKGAGFARNVGVENSKLLIFFLNAENLCDIEVNKFHYK